jgi:hypothetical protein
MRNVGTEITLKNDKHRGWFLSPLRRRGLPHRAAKAVLAVADRNPLEVPGISCRGQCTRVTHLGLVGRQLFSCQPVMLRGFSYASTLTVARSTMLKTVYGSRPPNSNEITIAAIASRW